MPDCCSLSGRLGRRIRPEHTHTTTTTTKRTQDMMHSLQFLVGDATTPWGKVRAQMGRAEPFSLNYVVIGNEGCLRPHYLGHFRRMAALIKAHYTSIKIIANCDLGASETFDMWEMHTCVRRPPHDTRTHGMRHAPLSHTPHPGLGFRV
jgi:alpha-L-arabinofuranosidase